MSILLELLIIAVGFVVGILSGFFGLGGGFILTPLLISLGLPANISIGTSIVGVFISSLVNSLRHKFLGNVEVKTGSITAIASIPGAECGARLIEHLKIIGVYYMNLVVSLLYALILGFISTYMIHERLSSKLNDYKRKNLSPWYRFAELKIPPFIVISWSSRGKISAWIIVLMGFVSGFFAGFLGAGGGFILIPLLIYVASFEPAAASGTCAFWILLNSLYASLTHALKGNVNFTLVLLILTGSLIGMQIGITAIKHVEKENFKLLFSLCLGFISISVLVKLLSYLFNIPLLSLLSPTMTLVSVSIVSLLIATSPLRSRKKR
ncbi:MAG: sulfite exporter TauE/SafE family protein [Candidatus Bathyarchaeia archaeon]